MGGDPVISLNIKLVSSLKVKQIFEAFFQSLRGCGLPEPTLHQYADACHPGDSVVQEITNASHFSRGEGEAQSCLNHPCKRDIKGNGMEGEKKEMISGKITTCPEGIAQN